MQRKRTNPKRQVSGTLPSCLSTIVSNRPKSGHPTEAMQYNPMLRYQHNEHSGFYSGSRCGGFGQAHSLSGQLGGPTRPSENYLHVNRGMIPNIASHPLVPLSRGAAVLLGLGEAPHLRREGPTLNWKAVAGAAIHRRSLWSSSTGYVCSLSLYR